MKGFCTAVRNGQSMISKGRPNESTLNSGKDVAITLDITIGHARSIEGPSRISVTIEQDKTTGSMGATPKRRWPSSRHEWLKTKNFQQSAIEEDGFVHALHYHVPTKLAVAQFFSDERVAAPHLN